MMKWKWQEGNWAAYWRRKYDEWHVSVPSDNGTMNVELFPDGVPGDSYEEREALARMICDAPRTAALEEDNARLRKSINDDNILMIQKDEFESTFERIAALEAELAALRATPKSIWDMADEDIREGTEGTFTAQIEADARNALKD